ncbi:hypothetical protein FKM82_028714, partial [Ascaphus truei]
MSQKCCSMYLDLVGDSPRFSKASFRILVGAPVLHLSYCNMKRNVINYTSTCLCFYTYLELPVASPLCHGILKTFQRWEQVLLRRLEIYGGPPQDFINIPTSEEALSAGPAILRHKALLEPTNTPFRSKQSSTLPVKRLWQYLVKQEGIQETFIRNIFAKKRCLNEIEADMGYSGGRARIIHKDSDIITAFAVNK